MIVSEWMPVLNRVRDRLVADGSIRGRRIAVSRPDEPKAAYLADVLTEAGADVTTAAPEVVIEPTRVLAGGACIATDGARCAPPFGQSAVTAVLDATNLLLAGKRFVCVGYGRVGKGVAKRARGMGAEVTVCEVDPFAALEAHHDGFAVAPHDEAYATAEILVAATGASIDTGALPDGAIVALDERDVARLVARAREIRKAREHVGEYVLADGRSLFVVGRAGEGQPLEIMDVTFSLQVLAARHLLLNDLVPAVHPLPAEIDEEVARMTLEALGLRIS